jgi:hypothetical protein
MPAIDLARLKQQTARLADLFDQPSEFLREHREVLDHYVNRTLRSQGVAPSSVLPTYRTPTVVLRQIETELGPLAEKRPIPALELADALWDEGWLETRLLAAFLLGRIHQPHPPAQRNPQPVHHPCQRMAVPHPQSHVVERPSGAGPVDRLVRF